MFMFYVHIENCGILESTEHSSKPLRKIFRYFDLEMPLLYHGKSPPILLQAGLLTLWL